MEIQLLSHIQFKVIVLKLLKELQENTDKEFSDIRKTIQAQNEKFNNEIKDKEPN